MAYKKVELPSDEPVQFVGVYALKWKSVIEGAIVEPAVGFVEIEDRDYSWVEPRLAALYARIADASDRSRFMGLLDLIDRETDAVATKMME